MFLVDNAEDPAAPKVKLLDWGIARVLGHQVRHTLEGMLVGTPQYVSPEQARGAEVTAQTDVYSLGVMAYELFTEQLPFEADTSAELLVMHLRALPPIPSELWPDIPPELEGLLLRMLAKHPDQRPTMCEVAGGLAVVRAELARRCSAVRTRSQELVAPQPEPAFAAQVARRRSYAGLALTEPASSAVWRAPPASRRKWQWALTATALAASALMFGFTRAADTATAAPLPRSAPSPTPPPRTAPAPVLAAPTPPRTEATSIALPALDGGALRPPPQLGAPPTRPGRRAPSRTKARAAPPVTVSRLPSDGTIDPYP